MSRIRPRCLCCAEGKTEMITEKETLLMRLRREMKEAPLPAPSPQKAEKRFLADGYERQTDEEPLQMTEKYRHRKVRMIMRVILICIILSFMVFAVLKAGIIRI